MPMTARRLACAAALATAALAGCSSSPAPRAPSAGSAAPAAPAVSTAQEGSVVLAPASASLVSGTLTATPTAQGVRFTGEIGGLRPNATHAIHVHETGDCSAVDASSAGAHFNPTASAHGRVGQGAHHAGDMDNLVADARGVARVDREARGVTLGGNAANDIAGRAVIVHGQPDDYASQPAGNAGARIACGVIKVVR